MTTDTFLDKENDTTYNYTSTVNINPHKQYIENCINFLRDNFKKYKEYNVKKEYLEKNGYYIVDDEEELTIYKNINI